MKRAVAAVLILALAAPLPAPLIAKPAASDPTTETVHTVGDGETLAGIANRAVVPRVLIIEANGLKPPYKVRPGQRLVIPRRRIHTVKPGETGFSIAMDYGVSWSAIATANGIDPAKPVKAGAKLAIPTIARLPAPVVGPPGSEPGAGAPAEKPDLDTDSGPRFAWPAPGKLLRSFVPAGRKGAHSGIDLAGDLGSAVRAVAPGRVLFAGEEPTRYGFLVVIDHGNGWASAYAKLQKVTVRKGERVRAGERIGLLGNTGETSDTALHFEIRRKNKAVDPELVLKPR